MTRILRGGRAAFTLVELLVAMAVIVVLASIALIVVPDVLDQDRTTDGASSLRQWLMIAKARAARDGQPRGVRLLTGLDPNTPAKTDSRWSTEAQYTEAPPVILFNPYALATPNDPRVALYYSTTAAGNTNPPPPPGSITGRTCRIENLTLAQAQQVVQGSLLSLPVLGTWHRVAAQPTPAVQAAPLDTTKYYVQIQLDNYPDFALGAAANPDANTPAYVAYHFGLSAPPQPLVGEPPLQLPRNICVDLGSSKPGDGLSVRPYDILFTPTGHVIPISVGAVADGQIFLWIRDYTKPGGDPAAYSTADFQKGGEQQVVALKARSGSMGVFPVMWPPYGTGQDAFTFARQEAAAP